MVPPQPLLHDDNWPLLTISKGFFETLAAKGAAAAAAAGGPPGAAATAGAAAAAAAVAAGAIDEGELEAAGWGDELDLGGGEGGAAAAGDGFPGEGSIWGWRGFWAPRATDAAPSQPCGAPFPGRLCEHFQRCCGMCL
jgi:coatomer protein complex subunit alpha (xenin)